MICAVEGKTVSYRCSGQVQKDFPVLSLSQFSCTCLPSANSYAIPCENILWNGVHCFILDVMLVYGNESMAELGCGASESKVQCSSP